MALTQGSFAHIDRQPLSTILDLQLQDSLNVDGSSKGKQREGTVSDAELALQLYGEDIRACQEVIDDRKMAQSIALAVLALRIQRDAGANDHEVDGLVDHEEPDKQAGTRLDPWADEELLAKAAAPYNEDTIISEAMSHLHIAADCVSDNETCAESSAWGAVRKTVGDNPKSGKCVACGDTKDFFDVARVPCNHEYCRECLADLFRASMTDEMLFPPRCDNKPVLLKHVRSFLPVELAKEFKMEAVELSTKNRIYCYDVRCSAFIPHPDNKQAQIEYVTCLICQKTTCTNCKTAAHDGDCPEDEAL